MLEQPLRPDTSGSVTVTGGGRWFVRATYDREEWVLRMVQRWEGDRWVTTGRDLSRLGDFPVVWGRPLYYFDAEIDPARLAEGQTERVLIGSFVPCVLELPEGWRFSLPRQEGVVTILERQDRPYPQSPGVWRQVEVRFRTSLELVYNLDLPADTPPGQYLVRVELNNAVMPDRRLEVALPVNVVP
ncbi:hypothetical protein Mterra_01009 [Calidithermus terrae]|uniref:Uncharacterized protein n=1 Tax=Calidithermus terrae TaxID=1408545 RepID=A0A399EUK5_9DEIN|nr:glycoside hydrolase family 61 protein [Calidithermus terrae]RIH88304.1 hypothetical protein Mterra_01009 [Calidithermus terrae]